MKKDKGAIEYSLSVMLILIFVLIMLFCFRIRCVRVEKIQIEDALAVSNLAAAVIDTDRYGETEELIITDFDGAYERYRQSLKTNLNLDENFIPHGQYLMKNPVKISEFHVYNVFSDRVEHIVMDEHGSRSMETLSIHGVTTPNGKQVESTTIYSKIEFDVLGFLDQSFRMKLDHSVDIVRN